MSSLQLNHLTKTSRSRESPEETETGVQIALDDVDHFAMKKETRLNCCVAHLPRPKRESRIENRTGSLRLLRIQIGKDNGEVAV
jgi:hypothetical protein